MNILRKIGSNPLVAIIGAVFLVLIFPSVTYGLSSIQAGALAAKGGGQPINLFGTTGIFTVISNTMLFVVGALSVIMLIVGGLRYVISGGNSSTVTSAKNTVLYAIIGLIIALLAYAAINFVLSALLPKA
jgi:hypothetical protein